MARAETRGTRNDRRQVRDLAVKRKTAAVITGGDEKKKATPKLSQACVKGQHLPEVVIN